jgi:hypothetical protein
LAESAGTAKAMKLDQGVLIIQHIKVVFTVDGPVFVSVHSAEWRNLVTKYFEQKI